MQTCDPWISEKWSHKLERRNLEAACTIYDIIGRFPVISIILLIVGGLLTFLLRA
jgi:hypothetical protein